MFGLNPDWNVVTLNKQFLNKPQSCISCIIFNYLKHLSAINVQKTLKSNMKEIKKKERVVHTFLQTIPV